MAKRTSKKNQRGDSLRMVERKELKRDLEIPGIAEQMVRSFQMIFGNWKLFLPLVVMGVVILALTVGATGFLNETAGVFVVLVFLFLWLVTIWLTRQRMAEHKVRLRDGLYNATGPLIATLVVFLVIIVECIPIFLFVIAYAAAIDTGFLATPFYAVLFWGFAAVMLTISGYLLASGLIALLAVTTPGVYPLKALTMAAELMMGRKIRFIVRLLALMLVLLVMFAIIVVPFSILKAPTEVMAVVVEVVGCFGCVYATVYLYMFYRYLLDA